jgi:hypothetical protein
MKTIFIVLFTVGAFFTNEVEAQKAESIMATFMGVEEGTYYFSQGEETLAFQEVDEKVLKVFNLDDDSLKNQVFKVTYTFAEDVDEESGDESTILTIVGLEHAKK